MAFPVSAEMDLILSLQAATLETGGWQEFLARLARITGARYAAILLRGQELEASQSIATAMPSGVFAPVDTDLLQTVLSGQMRPERIYAAADLADLGDTAGAMLATGLPPGLGATALRSVRTALPGGSSVTLAVFGTHEFDAADGSVLRQILPYLQGAVHAAVQIARERLRADLTADLSRTATLGWLLLDRGGGVLDTNAAERLPPGVRILNGPEGARVTFDSRTTATRWAGAVERAMADPATPPRALWICYRPAVYLRLAPFASWRPGAHSQAAAIATLHGQCFLPPERGLLLVDLFGLSPSEARLASALANGDSLAEAAATGGLTIATARNYSKRIFSKTGVRGQADLVRLIYAYGLGATEDGLTIARD